MFHDIGNRKLHPAQQDHFENPILIPFVSSVQKTLLFHLSGTSPGYWRIS
jgi:hypothetical protein